jgi:hypothetical protein
MKNTRGRRTKGTKNRPTLGSGGTRCAASSLSLALDRRSGRPLLQHPAPLPNGQARPRPSLAVAGEQRAGLVQAVAGEQKLLDVLAVPGPQLDFEEVAAVGDQGVVRLLLEEIVRRARRLAQPASRNGSLLCSKRGGLRAGNHSQHHDVATEARGRLCVAHRQGHAAGQRGST